MSRPKTQLSIGQTIVLNTFLKEMPAQSYSFNTIITRMMQLDENFPMREEYARCNTARVAEEMKITATAIDIVLKNYQQLTRCVRKLGQKLEAGQPIMDDWYELKPLLDRVEHYEVKEVEDEDSI